MARVVSINPSFDSDEDGDPNVTDPDDDNDGVTDIEERALGLHPYLRDSDGDGLLDGFEVQYAFNPLVVGEAGLDDSRFLGVRHRLRRLPGDGGDTAVVSTSGTAADQQHRKCRCQIGDDRPHGPFRWNGTSVCCGT